MFPDRVAVPLHLARARSVRRSLLDPPLVRGCAAGRRALGLQLRMRPYPALQRASASAAMSVSANVLNPRAQQIGTRRGEVVLGEGVQEQTVWCGHRADLLQGLGTSKVSRWPFIYAGISQKPEQTPGSGRTRTPLPWSHRRPGRQRERSGDEQCPVQPQPRGACCVC